MVPQLCNSRCHFIQFPMEPILKICRPQYFCVCCVEALSVVWTGITCTPVSKIFLLFAYMTKCSKGPPCMHTPIYNPINPGVDFLAMFPGLPCSCYMKVNRGGLETRLQMCCCCCCFSCLWTSYMQWTVHSNARWLQNLPGMYITIHYSNSIDVLIFFPVLVHATIFTRNCIVSNWQVTNGLTA